MSGHGKTKFSGKVRRAKQSDLDEIVCIECDCFESDIRWTGEDFTPLLTKPLPLSIIFSLAVLPATETSPEISAGYALACIEEDGSGSIYSMAVRKSFRGQGLGLMMLKGLCKGLQKKGASAISLEVEVTNKAAFNLYSNFGFTSTGPLPDYYGPGRDGIKMVLKP